MPWQKSKTGTPYYVVRTMVNGKRTYRYAGSGEAGKQAERQQCQDAQAKQNARTRELQLHLLFKRYERLVRQATDESMLELGYIRRPGSRWIERSRCRKLHSNERSIQTNDKT
jgi:hypothetical protein